MHSKDTTRISKLHEEKQKMKSIKILNGFQKPNILLPNPFMNQFTIAKKVFYDGCKVLSIIVLNHL